LGAELCDVDRRAVRYDGANSSFLGAFAKLQKATISFFMPVWRMEELGSHWTDFDAILYSSIFRKPI